MTTAAIHPNVIAGKAPTLSPIAPASPDDLDKQRAEVARAKAEAEYQKYRAFLDLQPRQVDADFEAAVKQLPNPPAKPKRLK